MDNHYSYFTIVCLVGTGKVQYKDQVTKFRAMIRNGNSCYMRNREKNANIYTHALFRIFYFLQIGIKLLVVIYVITLNKTWEPHSNVVP